MSMMPTLSDGFKQKYNITAIHEQFEGGQKDVYIATRNNEKIAVKRYKVAFDERAVREINILNKFANHNGIPRIKDVVQESNSTYVFEEYIEGISLHGCKDIFSSDAEKISKLITSICNVLEPIWIQKIVHRDLKPQNIIIKPDGNPVVIDFGIARDLDAATLTMTGEQPLTWQYAAPEQLTADRDQISYRTDFFSLGVITYHLLSGLYPFGATRQEIEMRIAAKNDKLAFVTLSQLDEFLSETLHFSQAERPRDVARMRDLLIL